VIHCSASPTTTTLEQIDEWHRARGFERVGYHYVIQSGGIVRKGRGDNQLGAHVSGHNTGSLGICITGSPAEGQPWSYDQEQQLYALITDLCVAHGITEASVIGHCELDPKGKPLCPGVPMEPIREQIRARLMARK
jgi:N-acetylmuramoyl-L-alanine amidase